MVEEPDPGAGPITTTINLLKQNTGEDGTETAQAPPDLESDAEAGSSSDEDRVIWMIIAGLAAVALLVALLTWRYWVLTRPGLDLSDDDDTDGGPDDGGGGGGYYGGGPSGDPYAAAAAPRRSSDPVAPGGSGGWQDPPARSAPRPDRGARNDPFPGGAPGPAPAPGRGRPGRGRRGGGDPFWEGADDQGGPLPPGPGEPPPPGRRRQDGRSVRETDTWGRNPRG